MQLKCLILCVILNVNLLVVRTEEQTPKSNDKVTAASNAVTVSMPTNETASSDKDDTEKDQPEAASPKKNAIAVEEDEEEEYEDDEGPEEEACDTRISSIVRNFDSTPLLPDDYEEAYEAVTKTDLIHKQYNITDMMSIVQRFIDYGMKISGNKDLTDTGMYISSVMMDRIYEAKVSAECSADLANIANGLRNGQVWPAKFLDSLGMIPSGFLTGHISALGEYDQCRGIKSPVLENGRRIYGKYCQMQARSIIPKTHTINEHTESIFRANKYMKQAIELVGAQANLDKFLDDGEVVRFLKEMLNWVDKDVCFFHLALCVPASCSAAELEVVVNQIVYPLIKLPFRIDYCEAHKDITEHKLEGVQWFAIIVLASFATVVAFSTLYHLYLSGLKDPKTLKKAAMSELNNNNGCGENGDQKSDSGISLCLKLEKPQAAVQPVRSICQQFALSFSMVANTEKLLAPDERFGALHSLQLLFTFFLFASQAFSFGFLITPQLLRNWVNSAPYQMINSNAYWFVRSPAIWVDGLIFLLGVSIVRAQFGRLLSARNRQFGFFAYLWDRWYRVSAAMFGALLLVYLLPLLGDGPFWYINRNWLWPACTRSSSLLSSFLYYSNWNPTLANYTIKDEFSVCNPPTWFFSVSMQLYLLAPLLFLPLYRWPHLGLTITVALLLLVSPLATLAPYLLSGKPTFLELTSHRSLSSIYGAFHQYTSNTFQYVTSLLIGLLTGYLIETQPQLRFGGRMMRTLIGLLSLASIGATFAWNNTFWIFNRDVSTTSALAWFVCSKFLFSGALGYIAYLCCTGRAGFLNPLLRLAEPIGKLSTSTLMLSAFPLLYRLTTPRHTYEMHFGQTLQNTVADFVLATTLAYLLYLLFEGPTARILEIFESDQLFKSIRRLQETESIEQLKPSASCSDSEDSAHKSNDSLQKAGTSTTSENGDLA